jgi:hypothetical protein
MTMAPLIAPHTAPTASTPTTPKRRLKRRADDDPRGEAVGQDEDHADRQVDAGGEHHQRLRHGDEREQHALVGGRLHDIGVKPAGMIGDVEGEHRDEDGERHQRAALFGEPEAPVLHRRSHAGHPASRRLDVERAGDQRMLGDLVADQLALDRAVVETSTRSQQPISSS